MRDIYLQLEPSHINRLTSLCSLVNFPVDVYRGSVSVDGCSAMGLMAMVGNTVKISPQTTDDSAVDKFFKLVESIGGFVKEEK